MLQTVSTRGLCPRHFALTPTRLSLLNQDSQNLVEFERCADGTLIDEPTITRTPAVCGNVLCEAAIGSAAGVCSSEI